MIHIDPMTTIAMISSIVAAKAMMLVFCAGAVLMCRKKIRWTSICAIARTASAASMLKGAMLFVLGAAANAADGQRYRRDVTDDVAAQTSVGLRRLLQASACAIPRAVDRAADGLS